MRTNSAKRAWIVKATWDRLDELVERNAHGTWVTKRPPQSWNPGDRLYFWQGRATCEVQALGELVKVTSATDDDGHTRFRVRYTSGLLDDRPNIHELRKDAVLRDASFLKSGPAGTVFPLTDEQDARLAEIIEDRNGDGRKKSSSPPRAPRSTSVSSRTTPERKPPSIAALDPGTHRVLSLHPWWAWAIIHAGKDIENRSWATPYRGRILIHASSKTAGRTTLEEIRAGIAARSRLPLDDIPMEFPRSQIVGSVELVDIVENARSKWAAPDCLHWKVRNPLPLTESKPRSGKLNLWTLTVTEPRRQDLR